MKLVDFGLGPYVQTTPSRRFPVYTRGNAGEVYPEVVFPLSTTMARDLGGDPFSDALLSTGVITRAECDEDADVHMGIFGGYSYLNLSVSRVIAVRTPGATIAETDATFLGAEGIAPPHLARRGDRYPVAMLRGVLHGLKVLLADEIPHLSADLAESAMWRASLPNPQNASDDDLVAVMTDSAPMLARMFTGHLLVSGGAGAAFYILRDICSRKLGNGSVALSLVSGIGEVASAEPSFALWDLSRLVAADTTLTSLFDDGGAGLYDRLSSARGTTAVEGFLTEFDTFLDNYGSRGPNEWEMACEVWGTEPAMPLAIIDRMRHAGEDHAPATRSTARVGEREASVRAARSRLNGVTRWLFDRALTSAVVHSRAREQGKAMLVKVIHDVRLAARELGRRMAKLTPEGRPDDLWYVTYAELDNYRRDPGAFADLVASRRATRDALSQLVPPFCFSGEMPPIETWERRAAHPTEAATAGTVLTGIPGCSGVVRGRACVVTDPSDPGDLGPGDILIAPLTDPSWTPLFVPVEAVVVDVGGQLSHAVIVSRELGLPCVVSATGASLSIPDGALVEVDGAAGTVTLLPD